MKAQLEIVNIKLSDVVTASGEATCCDWGCYTDLAQTSGTGGL